MIYDLRAYIGRRLDKTLLSICTNVTKVRIFILFRKGKIKINNTKVISKYVIQEDDMLTAPEELQFKKLTMPEKSLSLIKGLYDINKLIIYEDPDLLIINKPNGIATHVGTANIVGIIDLIKGIQQQVIFTHNRLDKYASGCMVMSKNFTTAYNINKVWERNQVHKDYLLCVQGKTDFDNTTISNLIQGKKVITQLCTIFRKNNFSILKASTKHGKKHQVRVHVASIGHPILGDIKYGSHISLDNNFIMLHCRKICLTIYEQNYVFKAPMTQIWNQYTELINNKIDF